MRDKKDPEEEGRWEGMGRGRGRGRGNNNQDKLCEQRIDFQRTNALKSESGSWRNYARESTTVG